MIFIKAYIKDWFAALEENPFQQALNLGGGEYDEWWYL
jgi:hypothetical protein